MAELTSAQIKAALALGRERQEVEPRALSARYDLQSGRVVIELKNGAEIAIPHRIIQGLERAEPRQIADVQIQGQGYGLRWEGLDLDLSVPGLLAGVFGTAAYMAGKAGRVRSAAKAAAARKNGKKGGRPRKARAA